LGLFKNKQITNLTSSEVVNTFETLFNASPIGFTFVRNNEILIVSEKFANIFGYTTDELVGMKMVNLHPEEVRATLRERGIRRLEGVKEPPSYETFGLKKDGTTFPIQLDVERVELTDGPALLAFIQDISNRKLAEEKLRESETKYRLVTEATFEALILSMDGKLVEANDAFAKIWGYDSVKEMVGKTPYDLATPESAELIIQNIKEGNETPYEFTGVKKDGTIIYLESVSRNFMYKGKKSRVTGMRDITDRKLAEIAMQESEIKFRSLIKNSPNDILTIDKNGNILFINRVSIPERKEKVIGMPLTEFFDSESSRKIQEAIDQAFRTGEKVSIHDIHIRNLHLLAHFIPFGITSEIDQVMIIITDVTEMKKATEKVKESEEKYRDLVESSHNLIWQISNSGTITFANKAVEQILGYPVDEVIGRKFYNFKTPEDLERTKEKFSQIMDGQSLSSYETTYIAKDKTDRILVFDSVPIRNEYGTIVGIQGIAMDVTERKQTEKDLQEANNRINHIQKIEAIGRFAGGIAHDFNNMLTIIQSQCDLLFSQITTSAENYEDVGHVKAAIEKATELTSQLLKFGKKQDMSPEVVNLNITVQTMSVMIKRIIPQNINLELNLEENIYKVYVDPSQIAQVIMNLIINAVDAMSEGGVLTLSTQNLTKENLVKLAVSDTGTGMDANTKRQLFEPFFTTKEESGTGLGLATSFNIIQQSNGKIEVKSSLNKGTTLSIYLPMNKKENQIYKET
jgi:PAS domain S-box-containing protein